MPDLSFVQQVQLAAIDKLLLGGVIGIAGLVGSRILERFKSNESLRVELSKRKAEKLAEVWTEFDQIESKATDLVFKIGNLRAEAWTAVKGPYILPRFTDLHEWPEDSAVEEVVKPRLDSVILPEILQLNRRAERLAEMITQNRFWLGRAVADVLFARCGTVKRYLSTMADYKAAPLREEAATLREQSKGDLDTFLRSI